MQTTMRPYEFLVRWGADGTLSGAHCQYRYVTTDETGAVIGDFIEPAKPVALAAQAGFPLSEVLNAVQVAALAARDAAIAERNALALELEAHRSSTVPAS
jgi:hypothetical protein